MNQLNTERWVLHIDWEVEWEKVEDVLGGAQASVKIVRHKQHSYHAFLKILNHQKDPERRARFFRESTAYDTHSHHGIPKLIQSNAQKHDDLGFKLFIVTEFIPGKTISSWVANQGAIDLLSAIKSTREILSIVDHCHSNQWIHRDIKPDNIIFKNDDPSLPTLLDFGLGYKDGVLTALTADNQELGNRFLRLPELSSGSTLKQDRRSDYAFVGGIFFFLLTSQMPFIPEDGEGKRPHQRAGMIEKIRACAGNAFLPLSNFLDKVFAPSLAERFSSVSEILQALEKIELALIGTQSKSSDEEWNQILSNIHTDANRRIMELKTQYDLALRVIKSAHQEILEKLRPTYNSMQTGYVNFDEGLKCALGFTHFSTQNQRYQPVFLIRLIGDEFVVSADGNIIFRTSSTAPDWGQTLKDATTTYFKAGLTEFLGKA